MDLASQQHPFPPGRTGNVARERIDAPPVGEPARKSADGGGTEGCNAAWITGDELVGRHAGPKVAIDQLSREP